MTRMFIKLIMLSACIALNSFPGVSFAKANVRSVYTQLNGKNCQRIDEYSSKCMGIAGYSLIVLDDDNRMSLDVVGPDKSKYSLDYWSIITPGFSTLGNKAEWRVTSRQGKIIPIAIIVRVNDTRIQSERPKDESVFAIAKITDNSICVTDKLSVFVKNSNQKARNLADKSQGKECLK